MYTEPIEIPRSIPSATQLPIPRHSSVPRNFSTAAPYASSQHSGKSPKKEPVHLPYTSAQPDFADLPKHHASQGGKFRSDNGYTPRYHQTRNRLQGFTMAAFYGGTDYHILSSSRSLQTHRNHQMLPQISILPAPKHARMQQKKRFPVAEHNSSTPQPISIKRVEVSLHEVQHKKRSKDNSAIITQEDNENHSSTARLDIKKTNHTTFQKEPVNVPLRSVDLNKGLNAASAIKHRTRDGAKYRARTLEEALAVKEDVNVMSLNHLPLKEVYLKPDIGSAKEQAFKQQHDKTIRILKWLKDLRYLDEKTVQKSRLEVEKTQFQLPEIKEPTLAAFI